MTTHRFCLAALHRLLCDKTSVFHPQPTSRQVHLVEVAVIVRYRYHGLTGSFQLRQQVVVELTPKFRILIGGPFVQQQNRPLFQ